MDRKIPILLQPTSEEGALTSAQYGRHVQGHRPRINVKGQEGVVSERARVLANGNRKEAQ